MNLSTFLDHWSIAENPFRAEEARHDSVFARLGSHTTAHPDFEKILGDPARPSTAIVFGEKGSGKTAIRLQIAERVRAHNESVQSGRVLLVAYDDLNPFLDRLAERAGLMPSDATPGELLSVLEGIRLVDHIDGILHAGITPFVDALIAQNSRELHQRARAAPISARRDLYLLAALYDLSGDTRLRMKALRKRLKVRRNTVALWWRVACLFGWILPAAVAYAHLKWTPDPLPAKAVWYAYGVAVALWAVPLFKWAFWDRWRSSRLGRRLARQLRSVPRGAEELAAALEMLHPRDRDRTVLPFSDSDDTRYALLAKFRHAMAGMGVSGVMVLMDRLDEPTLISGDPARMRAVVWPMFNNKFLQQEGIGFKMLLPIELRHELFRERAGFFQEARLDKQNMIERLAWTGATLYDLCNARLNACRAADAPAMSLADLFDDEVSRADIVDALDQMRQPRDAFKLLYQCMLEHCSNTPQEQSRWRIPRLTLDSVRRAQSERVEMFYRGVRPA
ncbi:MAG: hypothetical protein H6812_04290 [Phycisphaeraceae bacterium]|nr:hypothetical protein [Phycisphaerales bacterium]MCB9842457.1 hypothetical protein [Phycisphaeraceae bacterium]